MGLTLNRRVLGSIPRRLTTFPKGICEYTLRASRLTHFLTHKDDMAPNITLEAGPAVFNLSCYAYFMWGRDFADAARLVSPTRPGINIVPYFLHCQAIELGLKAFLLLKGMNKNDVRKKYGHDLAEILGRAKREGLDEFVTLTVDEESMLQKATVVYDSRKGKKALQYFDVMMAMTGYKRLPNLESLESISQKLFTEALEKACLNAR